MMGYPIVILPLSDDDGGGFMGFAPDLPGCVSDGETRDEAARNAEAAITDWLEEADRLGRTIPAPGSAAAAAQREREKLVDVIKQLADACLHMDGRIDELVARLTELNESAGRDLIWPEVASLPNICPPRARTPGRVQ